MRDFFVGKKELLETFGPLHIVTIIVTITLAFLIVYNRDKINKIDIKNKRRIVLFIIGLLFMNMTIYYLSKIIYGVYNVKVHLPFHFCFISNYLFIYAWLFKKVKLIRITYFLGYMGPFVAMIWPDSPNPTSFVFYQYIISHHILLLSNLFIYYMYNYTITKKEVIKTFFIVNGIFIVAAIFNYIFKTNYIMSNSLPEFFLNLYPIFRKFNYPVIILELGGIMTILIANIPLYFNKLSKKHLHNYEDLL